VSNVASTSLNLKEEEGIWSLVKPLVLKSIIGSVVAAGLVGVFAMVVGDFNTLHLQLILTIILIVAFSLMSWYDADVSSKRSSTFALIGVFVSLYLLLVGFLKIWVISDPYTTLGYDGNASSFDTEGIILSNMAQWIWLVLIARGALLHSHLLLNIHRKYNTPILTLVAQITFVLIILFAILLSVPHIFENLNYAETYWRITGAVAILDVLGTILIPLSSALFNPKAPVLVTQPQPAYPAQKLPAPQGHPLKPAGSQFANQQFQPLQANPVASAEVTHTPGSFRFETPPNYSRALAWPRYMDGSPLPANADGTPNFSQVEKY
jgi:hypothetical protein